MGHGWAPGGGRPADPRRGHRPLRWRQHGVRSPPRRARGPGRVRPAGHHADHRPYSDRHRYRQQRRADRRIRARVDSVGAGGGVAGRLRELGLPVLPYTGAAKTKARTRDGDWGFANARSAAYWRMRELLDPAFRAQMMLSPNDLLLPDLNIPTRDVTTGVPVYPGRAEGRCRGPPRPLPGPWRRGGHGVLCGKPRVVDRAATGRPHGGAQQCGSGPARTVDREVAGPRAEPSGPRPLRAPGACSRAPEIRQPSTRWTRQPTGRAPLDR